MQQIEKAKSYAPTDAMRRAAKRGLELRAKYNRGGLDAKQASEAGVGSGVARARDIINGNLSLDTVKRMHAFFSRHEKNYRPDVKESDGGPTAGTIAWYIWGGSSGKAWSESILRKEDILKSYTPTDAVLNTMQRGSALVDKYNINKSCNISFDKNEFSLDDVKQIYRTLSALEKVDLRKRNHDGSPDDDVIKWYEHGGSAGLAWSRLVLREQQILKSYSKEITEQQLNTEDQLVYQQLDVAKSLNEEKRLATFLVLEPQDDDGTTNDLHEDWYDAETVEKSCYNFNKTCMRANLLHMMPTSAFEFVESYITKSDSVLGGKFIKKGSWLATIHVDESPLGQEIWDGIKSGYFNGLSIQALGTVEDIKEEND